MLLQECRSEKYELTTDADHWQQLQSVNNARAEEKPPATYHVHAGHELTGLTVGTGTGLTVRDRHDSNLLVIGGLVLLLPFITTGTPSLKSTH